MGGVINISSPRRAAVRPIQRAHRGRQLRHGVDDRIDGFGSQGPWSYAFTAGAQSSQGFSRYMAIAFPPSKRTIPNPRAGWFQPMGRLCAHWLRCRGGAGLRRHLDRRSPDRTRTRSGRMPISSTRGACWIRFWAKASVDTLDGKWTHQYQYVATQAVAFVQRIVIFPFEDFLDPSPIYIQETCRRRIPGDLAHGWLGSLIYGARTQHETADIFSDPVSCRRFRLCAAGAGQAGHQFAVRAVANCRSGNA